MAAAMQVVLESDVRALERWAGPRRDSAIVPHGHFDGGPADRFSLLWRADPDLDIVPRC
jgi:hypothetical protein